MPTDSRHGTPASSSHSSPDRPVDGLLAPSRPPWGGWRDHPVGPSGGGLCSNLAGMHKTTGLPVVGMVGGGQLARMTHQAAIALGQSLRVLAAAPDDGAALVARRRRASARTPTWTALRAFAEGCDVVTFDHEHVPTEHIRALAAAGCTVLPPADALLHAQDKRVMRDAAGRARRAGAAAGRPVGSAGELAAFAGGTAGRWWSRRPRGGYDGRGVWVLSAAEAGGRAARRPGTPLIVEERVPLRRELAAHGGALAVRAGRRVAGGGDRAARRHLRRGAGAGPGPRPASWPWPPSSWPCGSPPSSAWSACSRSSCSRPPDGALLVNELAMRPHNSGHWTIEGARTSQFEQHLRAVLDYPLGATALTAPVVVMANVLGGPDRRAMPGIDERVHHLFAADPALKVHLYGKQVRPGPQDRPRDGARATDLDGAAPGRAAARPRDAGATGLSDEVRHSGRRSSA